MPHEKVDKLRRYKIAFCINTSVGVLQLLVVLLIADSLALFGDMMHSIADTLIIAGTIYVIAHEISDPLSDHSGAKKKLVWVAVALLWISALYVGFEAYDRLQHPVGFPGWPVAILALLSGIGNLFAHRIVSGVAIGERDAMHKINRAHLLTDGVLSLGVFISAVIVLAGYSPSWDARISFVLALWMIYLGWDVIRPKKHTHDHHCH